MQKIYVFLLIMITGNVYAQSENQGRLLVTVENERKEKLVNATVELLKASDSSLIKVAITDVQGQSSFDKLSFGDYILKVSEINHQLIYSERLSIQSTDVQSLDLTMRIKDKEVAGVSVTARKPFIQRLSDRIVVNVEGSILSAGSTAFEVLERSPGVNIDGNDVISLSGKAGVLVMIDGKMTAMSGQDLVNYLRGLPSSAIERIEVITNPSSKYDAAGNSGIIDIRLKKDQRYGFNGTVTSGYGQGVYPKTNAGINFNYRNKKFNLFGSYNYTYRVGMNKLYLDRNFFDNSGNFFGKDLKANHTRLNINGQNMRLGLDYNLSKKTIVGFIFNGNRTGIEVLNKNNATVIDKFYDPVNTFMSRTDSRDNFKNWLVNVNVKHQFDSLGRELTADFDHIEFNNRVRNTNATDYYKMDGDILQPSYILKGDQRANIKLSIGKADYTQPIFNGGKMEAGVKLSDIHADSDAKFFDVSTGSPVNDVNKTNHFIYSENIYAAYLNLQKRWNKWSVQAGLRAEQTSIKTHQQLGDVKWDSSYLQFFPSAFVNYHLAENKTLSFSASRRIDRPNYNQLNPFLFLIDVTTYSTGRPELLPAITWKYEVGYNVKGISMSVEYSRTSNNINTAIARFEDVFPQIPSAENVTIQIPVNLTYSDFYGATLAMPLRIRSWWNMLNNANFYYEKFNGSLGATQLNTGKPVVRYQMNNTFTFKKSWSAELNGNISTSSQYGFAVFRPQWAVGVGVQKSLWNNKATVRFNFTDIFWTGLPRAVITYNNYIEKWHSKRETRVAGIQFTYRFGSNKVQQARNRRTAADEEIRRVN